MFFYKSPLPTLCLILLSLLFIPTGNECYGNNWQNIVDQAKGQTVDWYMWGGSPAVNGYVNGFVANHLKEKYDITLRQVPVKDIAEVVNKLIVEKQAGKKSGGSVDLIWINGENFRTCKNEGLLYGPFSQTLPNIKLVNQENPSINRDFGTPVAGMESPWGSAQIVLIHDKQKIPAPPQTMTELIGWIKKHPGRFTYPAPPDFTGSAFIRQLFYHVNGGFEKWQHGYSTKELHEAMAKTYGLLNELKPSLWRRGSTYPDSPVRMNNLFVDNQVDFSFSYNQGEATRNILDGLFPETVRTFVLKEGTLANTHFVAIPFNGGDKEAAMVTANFLLSPLAQAEKAKPSVWGDFPVISRKQLTQEQQQLFEQIPRGIATLPLTILQNHQVPELPGDILVQLEKGWEKNVLKKSN